MQINQSPQGEISNNFSLKDFKKQAKEIIHIEREQIILWIPLLFGIGACFAIEYIPLEKYIPFFIIGGVISAILLFLKGFFYKDIFLPFYFLFICIASFSFGAGCALLKIQNIKAPVIDQIYKSAQVSGKIIKLDKNTNNKWRILLETYSVDNNRKNIPKYMRLTLSDKKDLAIGDVFNCSSAFLSPPNGAIYPDAYNFARKAWFMQLGAVGSCRDFNTQKVNASFLDSALNNMQNYRMTVSAYLAQNKTGGGGGFLSAVITGDRSYISKDDLNALQIAGLGHIISVSGMHISVLAALAYFLFLKLFSLSENLALRFDVRKISAFITIFLSAFYVLFSGYEPPAIRALIMTSLFLIGIILDRQAINMRSLALSALIILIFAPEDAIDAGFLMSYLATLSLVAVWNVWNHFPHENYKKNIFEKIKVWFLGAMFTSFVASLATLPIVVKSFDKANPYSILSNIIAAPISDYMVAPFSLVAVLLSPINLSWPFWAVARFGLKLIIDLAYWISSFPFANFMTPLMDNYVCFILVLSIFWICLWKTKLRLIGIAAFIIFSIIWIFSPQPVAIIARNGEAIIALEAKYQGQNRVCFSKGGKFSASWLFNNASVSEEEKEYIESEVLKRFSNRCSIIGDDYSIKYIKNNPDYNLKLNLNNHIYYMGKELKEGAIIVRRNNLLELKFANNHPAPWSN